MTRIFANASRAVAVLLAATLISIAAGAQQPQTPGSRPLAPAGKGPLPAGKEAAPASESALRQRVEQLEEQLVDMHVVVGTLESLARGVASGGAPGVRASPGAAAALDASDAGRLDGLEMQIRALAAQLEQLQEQVRALGGRSGGLTTSTAVATNEPQNPAGRPGRPEAAPQQPERPGFGSVTVSPESGKKDEINRLLTEPAAKSGGQGANLQQGAGQADPEVDPKQLYSTAYGYLIQRDYGAAEAAFEDFLRQHPSHPLAGNATYWMGESLYVRGQYRAAASAFLKGYQTYAKSEKAPESLLKLAMSLQRLGQKDAACSSYSELSSKFPDAPARVKSTAASERQRVGC